MLQSGWVIMSRDGIISRCSHQSPAIAVNIILQPGIDSRHAGLCLSVPSTYGRKRCELKSHSLVPTKTKLESQVCGFLGSSNEKLCARWATLGAFHPFFRNHADYNSRPQEFYQWPLVASAAKHAISIRYRLLDYLYTAMYKQSKDGTPAINPIWYLYPHEEKAFPIDLQYFYGDCILVSPVTDEDATNVRLYLPDDIYYELETQKPIRGHADWVELKDVSFDRIPLHIRGGCIVPLRTSSANTTTELRKKGFELLVAPGLDGTARGSLYVDDGVTLDGGPKRTEVTFQYRDEKLETVITEGLVSMGEAGINVEKVTILGGPPDDDGKKWNQDEL